MTTTEQSVHARIKWLLIAGGVLVAIAAFSLVWVPYQRQVRLIEEIEAIGGWVVTDPGGPGWLQQLIGDDRMRGFEPVVGVYFYNASIDDAWLKRLGRLSSLEELSLNDTQVSDGGLEHLAELSRLKLLLLNGTQIGDDGLSHLTGLSNLQLLFLNNTQVSSAGLEKLQQALPDCMISL